MSEKQLLGIRDLIESGETIKAQRAFAASPDLLRKNVGNCTWLGWAAYFGQEEVARLLLSLGCKVDEVTDNPRDTPLRAAIQNGHLGMARLLLKFGANPNANTFVINAIVGESANTLEFVKLLDKYGADLHYSYIHKFSGQPTNALSMAIDYGKEDVAEYLRSRGCVMPKAAPTEAPASLADEIVAYFNQHFGRVSKQVLIEIVPSDPPIAVHVIPRAAGRDHVTLFTTGMSEQPMKAPKGGEEYRFAELFIQLPGDWKYKEIADANHGWPVHWLRLTAKNPHQSASWLGGPVAVIANGDPPEQIAPKVDFTGMLLIAERHFVAHDGRTVQLYRMTPLYPEEQALEKKKGIAALMRAFDKHDVPFVVNLKRKNVAAK